MFRYFFKNSFLLIAGIIGIVNFFLAYPAMAVTQSITAKIAFGTPLSLKNTTDINSGSVNRNASGVYTVSPSGGIIVAGSMDQTVSISVGNYMAARGIIPQKATCSYNGAPVHPCTTTGALALRVGKILRLSAEAVVDETQSMGTAEMPSFTVMIVYQ